VESAVFTSRVATRLTESELLEHPDWEIVRRVRIPPVRGGMLAAPLVGRNGDHLGVIYLSDRGDPVAPGFSADDEMVAVQLAQMASIAIENILFSEEREANRIKDEFLSMLSHELRTPLNAILGWTQLLRLDHGNPAAQSEGAKEDSTDELAHGLEVIERNARSQAKLVEDMLDVSRVTTGKLKLTRRPVALAPLIRAAVDVSAPDANAKGVDIAVALRAESGTVMGDPDRLQQVVWNLLSNAVKFTPRDGRVEVRLDDDANGHLRMTVSDTGRGISHDFLPHVFDRFQQADSTSTRAHGGLGIGLTIVRHIVELHGGTVSADSPGEGRGSTFTVVLPAIKSIEGATTTATRDVATSRPQRPDVSPSTQRATRNKQPAARETRRTRDKKNDAPDLRNVSVLVVDDAPDALEFIVQTLRKAGATVTAATSAKEAIDRYNQSRPDVLVTDLAMPERDGYDLIRDLRELAASQGHSFPAIALTAYAREEDRLRVLSSGFQIHLPKPVEPARIVSSVAYLASKTEEESTGKVPKNNPEQSDVPARTA
jgi:signal transduction histidine kinase/ActR/RegA family two-component response regulator